MARLLTFDDGHFLASGAGYYASAPPSLALSVVSTTFAEGATITFRVTASKLWDEDITVAYATSDGTATAGVDYTAASGSVTLPAGSSTVDLSVVTIDRDGVQSSRTFTMTISSPLTTSGDTPLIETAAQTVTIEDTDVALPVPSLVASVIGPAEEGSTLTFRVATQAFAPTPSAITFQYETRDGTAVNGVDYVATAGDGFIPAGAALVEYPVQTLARSGYQGARTVQFVITTANTTIATATVSGSITDTDVPTGSHGYFESLVTGPYAWKSLSFRNVPTDTQTINQASQKTPNIFVTYSPGTDTHPHAQDAAKVWMPAWQPEPAATVYGTALDASALTLVLGEVDGSAPSGNTAFNAKAAYVRIGDEIMLTVDNTSVFDKLTGVLNLAQRGAVGTTPAVHPVGTPVYRSINSLPNQVRPALGTSDGNIYYFTWDMFYDDSHYDAGVGTWKMFQFLSDQSIWLEPRITFGPFQNPPAGWIEGTHIATLDVRTYNNLGGNADYTLNPENKFGLIGPNATKDGSTLAPQLAQFLVRKHCWTRWHVKLDQRANDYDLFSMWVSDEVTDPVLLFDGLQIDVRGKWNGTTMEPPSTVNRWALWFNTSTTSITGGRVADFRDLIAYVRNFCALEGVPDDVSSFLLKPEA